MFLLNLIINYFIVLATAKLCALPLKRLRFAVSAAAGALYSVLLLFKPLSFLASPVMKLVLGFLMTLIAFGVALSPASHASAATVAVTLDPSTPDTKE